MGFIYDNILEYSSRHLLVELGCCEVHISGDKLAGFDQGLGHDVFGRPALMCWDNVVISQDFFEILEEPLVMTIVVRCVCRVEHPFPLIAAHGGGATI